MDFENNDSIQWDEREVTLTSPHSILGEVKYLNPPKFFQLRGVRYRYLNMTKTRVGGEKDGANWHLAQKTDNGEKSKCVWVCEAKPGEFVEVFIPVELKDAPFVA